MILARMAGLWLMLCAVVCLIEWVVVPLPDASARQNKQLPANWDCYSNDRFGQTVDYPKDVFAVQDSPPTNGDGARFHTRDGKASFTASGSFNAMDLRLGVKNDEDETLESFEKTATEQRGWKVTYQRKGKNFILLSGTKADRIFYEKTMLVAKDQIMVTLWIEYPMAQKAVFDKVVSKMAASFNSDGGSEGDRSSN